MWAAVTAVITSSADTCPGYIQQYHYLGPEGTKKCLCEPALTVILRTQYIVSYHLTYISASPNNHRNIYNNHTLALHRSSDGKLTSEPKDFLEEEEDREMEKAMNSVKEEDMEREEMEALNLSLDIEREMLYTYGRERLEDSPIIDNTSHTSKDNLPSDALLNRASDDVLSNTSSNVKESSESKSTLNTDERDQTVPSELLNDHHASTSGSCRSDGGGFASHFALSLDPPPVAAELCEDAEVELETFVSMEFSRDKTSEGVGINAMDASAEAIEDEEIFYTDTAVHSEKAFHSVSVNSEALLSDSTGNENTDMDADSEGDFWEGEHKYESDDDDDDDSFHPSDYYSDLFDTDDSSDGEMSYVNEAELSNLWYASSSGGETYSDTNSDESTDKPTTDVGFDIEGKVEEEAENWNEEKEIKR